jgi:hypothetical protein
MSRPKQLIIGLIAEGPTDYRFLSNVARRTYEFLAFDCRGDIEILDIVSIYPQKTNFVEFVQEGARKGYEEYGIMVLRVHSDADHRTDLNTYRDRIDPSIVKINEQKEELCRNIVPIVPIVEIEAWLLAEEKLFLDEIGSSLSYRELNLNRNPEDINDPKRAINEAIRIANEHYPRRRARPQLSELYLPIGQIDQFK